jgi:hypothetical protein
MKWIVFFALSISAALGAQTHDNVTIYEVDGQPQTDRPVTFGRIFKRGEIGQCPQPVVSGYPVASFQADVKNRWPDGSVKFAVVSFTANLAARDSIEVGFRSVAFCNNTSYLTQAQMANFNGGHWGAQVVVTPAGGEPVVTEARTMLSASDPGADAFGDCRNDFWLQGPVVTAVIVQDCTSTSAYDFGWLWNGSVMAGPATGNASTASFHPMFILYFYPGLNAVQVEYILEIPWSGRVQDQLADIAFNAGSPPSRVWSHSGARLLTDLRTTKGSNTITSAAANFTATDVGLPIAICGAQNGCSYNGAGTAWYTIASVKNPTTTVLHSAFQGQTATNLKAYVNLQVAGTRHRHTFWSGTAPGHIRIDHNFAHLKETMAFPNYDSHVSVDPESNCNSCTPYSTWKTTDKGDIGGYGGIGSWAPDYADNGEGAPIQREELQYLYNMATCGRPNGACAKAWQELTGEAGLLDTKLTEGNVSGGGGAWNNFGNVPFHLRESRTVANGNQTTTNFFFCPGFADKNAAGNSTNCKSGIGNAVGKPLSRHAHSSDQWSPGNPPVAAVGTISVNAGGWSVGGCNHWLDYAYTPYLLTGDYYYLENEYQSASMCLESANPDPAASWGSNRTFAYMNPAGAVLRELGWGLQTVGRAAFIAPDETPEENYYLAMLNSNLEVEEGVMNLIGTPLTPTDTSCSAASCSYMIATANRWNWGRATVMSQCSINGTCKPTPVALHAVAAGSCPTSAQKQFVDDAVTSSYYPPWMFNFLSIALSELREMGYSQAAAVSEQMQQALEEQVLDDTYNPYLVAAYEEGVKEASGGMGCNPNSSMSAGPFINNYARKKKAVASTIQAQATFNAGGPAAWQNIPCADHGYSLVARAAASYLEYFETSSSDANCPKGTCAASDTWNWLNTHVPYFSNSPAGSHNCVTPSNWQDEQIKYALAPRRP